MQTGGCRKESRRKEPAETSITGHEHVHTWTYEDFACLFFLGPGIRSEQCFSKLRHRSHGRAGDWVRRQRVFAAAHGAQAAPHLALRPVFGLSILIRLCAIRLCLYREIVVALGAYRFCTMRTHAAESKGHVGSGSFGGKFWRKTLADNLAETFGNLRGTRDHTEYADVAVRTAKPQYKWGVARLNPENSGGRFTPPCLHSPSLMVY
jgi:hypothetical protein